VLLSSACGGGPSGGDGGAPITSPQAFCDDFFGTVSSRLQTCCTAADQQTQQYKLAFAFVEAFAGVCGMQLGASVQSGRASFDENAAAACVAKVQAAFNALGCGALQGNGIAGMMLACGAVTVGKQNDGQPCASDYECTDGLTCVGYAQGQDGACHAGGQLGAACGPGHSDGGATVTFTFPWGSHPACASGFYCSAGQCAAQAPSGSQCFDDNQCESGLTCHDGKCGTAGPAPVGGMCFQASDCQDGLYCTNQSCASKLSSGTPCTSDDSCKGLCARPDGGGQGTCNTFCGSG